MTSLNSSSGDPMMLKDIDSAIRYFKKNHPREARKDLFSLVLYDVQRRYFWKQETPAHVHVIIQERIQLAK